MNVIFYSHSSKGFYFNGIHTELPYDAIEITKNLYIELLDGQAKGKDITVNEKGTPYLIDQPEPTYEELMGSVRLTRELEYTRRVRPFLEEAELKRYIGEQAEYTRLMDLAVQEREQIQIENPWPTPSEV